MSIDNFPNQGLAHGMYDEPIHHWVSAADAVASHRLSNYPNYRVDEGYAEGYGPQEYEGYDEGYGAWVSSISQLPDALAAAGQPPPIGPIGPVIGDWSQVRAILEQAVFAQFAGGYPSDWNDAVKAAFMSIIFLTVQKYLDCFVAALKQKYTAQDVLTTLSQGGATQFNQQMMLCGWNALQKKVDLTGQVFDATKTFIIPPTTAPAAKVLTCLNGKLLDNSSPMPTPKDSQVLIDCENSTGISIGTTRPLIPLKPGKPVGSRVPWYASPLVWSLIALGAFLLVIIIIIIVTSVQNNKKARAMTFSWANSRW